VKTAARLSPGRTSDQASLELSCHVNGIAFALFPAPVPSTHFLDRVVLRFPPGSAIAKGIGNRRLVGVILANVLDHDKVSIHLPTRVSAGWSSTIFLFVVSPCRVICLIAVYITSPPREIFNIGLIVSGRILLGYAYRSTGMGIGRNENTENGDCETENDGFFYIQSSVPLVLNLG
jgi:hypothetical protein